MVHDFERRLAVELRRHGAPVDARRDGGGIDLCVCGIHQGAAARWDREEHSKRTMSTTAKKTHLGVTAADGARDGAAAAHAARPGGPQASLVGLSSWLGGQSAL